ncbi:cytochrome P450 [Usnea florida]
MFTSGGGMYIWKIQEMHERYGPIVRINPHELHIKDIDFYDQIYASAPSRRDKYEYSVKSPDSNSATGFTVDHDLHRLRREALSPFFSKRNVARMEPLVKAKVQRLRERLEEHMKLKASVNLTVASLAFTMDILSEYAFHEDFGSLNQEDFNVRWRDTILSIMRALPAVRHFGWLLMVAKALPQTIRRLITPDMSQLIQWKEHITMRVKEVLAEEVAYSNENSKQRTIFEELRDNPSLPPEEKTLTRLGEECSILLIAGSETPAKALALIFFHLMVSPLKLQRLRDELRTITPPGSVEIPSQAKLEKLPYLSAIVHEGLRLHSGIVARSQRIASHPLQYREWTIPPGTPLSCISAFIHYDPNIFPEPRAFRPERWLITTSKGEHINQALKHHFVPFGRGTRNCLGYNLAYAMLYLSIAGVAGSYDMEPFQTSSEDVDLKRDWVIPQPRIGSQGVRAMVLRKVPC